MESNLKLQNHHMRDNILFDSQRARMQNTEERARDLRFEPICNFVFMHGTSEHRNGCRMRHKLVSTDILDEKTNQIQPGTLRFHIINIISPTEYIVRPVSFQTDDNKWHPMAGSDEFVCLDTKIQQFYRNSNNPKRLIVLALGEKCVVEKLDKFYRGEIIKMYPKRYSIKIEIFLEWFKIQMSLTFLSAEIQLMLKDVMCDTSTLAQYMNIKHLMPMHSMNHFKRFQIKLIAYI